MLFFHLTDEELRLKEPKGPTAGESGELGRSRVRGPSTVPDARARTWWEGEGHGACSGPSRRLESMAVGRTSSGTRRGHCSTRRGGREAAGRDSCIVCRVSCKPSTWDPLFKHREF